MGVLKIAEYPHTILRRRAKKVTKFDKKIRQFVNNLASTMYVAKGVGISAPQVGALHQIIGVDVGEGFLVVVNPGLIHKEEEQVDIEGCLSLPSMVGNVKRANKVVIEGLDADGKFIKIEAEGLLARVIQHEIDHLNGILIIDRAIEFAVGNENNPEKTVIKSNINY